MPVAEDGESVADARVSKPNHMDVLPSHWENQRRLCGTIRIYDLCRLTLSE